MPPQVASVNLAIIENVRKVWHYAMRVTPALILAAILTTVLWSSVISGDYVLEHLGKSVFLLLGLLFAPFWYLLVRASIQKLGVTATYLATALPYAFPVVYFANELNYCATCGEGHCGAVAIGYIIMIFIVQPTAALIVSMGFTSTYLINMLIPYGLPFLLWVPEELQPVFAVAFLVAATVAALSSVFLLLEMRYRSYPRTSPSQQDRRYLVAVIAGLIITLLGLVLWFTVIRCNRLLIYAANVLLLGPTITAIGLGLCRIQAARPKQDLL